jgi:hypothetical protein
MSVSQTWRIERADGARLRQSKYEDSGTSRTRQATWIGRPSAAITEMAE